VGSIVLSEVIAKKAEQNCGLRGGKEKRVI